MPTATFIHDGDTLDYTPTVDVAAGDLVFVESILGVAKHDIPANTLGSLAVRGVFEIAAEAPVSYDFGVPMYWNQSEAQVTFDDDGGTRPLVGYVATPSPAAATQTVRVLLRSSPAG